MEKFLDAVAKLLAFLDGKKAAILAITSAINAYAVATGLYDANLGALVGTILSILTGGAFIATPKMMGRINK